MRPIIALLLVAGASFAQSDAPPPKRDLAAERQQARDLLKDGKTLAALPLVEDLVAANPDDATAQGWLAYCLFSKSRHDATPAEAPALLKRAREAASRAKQLGNQWPLLNDLLTVLNDPAAAQPSPYSASPEANTRMKEGEQAFAKGDFGGAQAAYTAALKIDPKLYMAAVFGGDVCFRTKDIACASEWFRKAVAIDPTKETAYRYWGDALMAAGKQIEARDKFIEAVIAEPTQKPWGGLMNWAKQNHYVLTAPKIDRPAVSDDPHKMEINHKDLDDKNSGRSLWINYSITRSAWRLELFAKNYPKETQYRHTLAEEVAALNSVANAIDRQKPGPLDPQLANLAALHRDGLLEAWILLSSGADAGIAQDYAAYRATHHDELRAYFDKYIIHPAPAAPPTSAP